MNDKTVLAAIDLTLALITRAARISTLVAQAQAANRTELNQEEWDAINTDDGTQRQRLVDGIAKAKTEGR